MESLTEYAEDSRNVMVKILVPGSDETRNRVILATNNQTQVKKTSLRATDQIHIQIELYMKRNGLKGGRTITKTRGGREKRS